MRVRPWLRALLLATALLAAFSAMASAAPFLVTMSTRAGPPGTYVTIRIDVGGQVGDSRRSKLFLVPPEGTGSGPCADKPGAAMVGTIRWHEVAPTFVGIGSFTVADVPPGEYAIAQNVPDASEDGSPVGPACFGMATFRVLVGMPDSAMAAPPLAFPEHNQRMSDAFDGAGEPYRGPSFKAGILILLGIIIATFIIWNLASWGMELLNVSGPVDNPPRLPGAGQ